MKAPKAQKIEKILKDQRRDPYYWMNQRDSSAVLSHIATEQEYFEHKSKPAKELQDQIYEELKKKIPGKESTPPYPFKNYLYWSRYEDKKEYSIYCRKKINTENEEIILDVNELAKEHKYYSLSNISLSFSHRFIAFSADSVGRRFYTICFKDLEKNQILPNNIPDTAGDMVWANDDRTLFYVKQDAQTLRPHKVFRYDLKTQEHTLVFEEKDETFYIDIFKSLSEKYIFIQSLSSMTTESRFIPADKPANNFEVFLERKRKHKYFVEDGRDCFYILTNSNDCKNYRLDQASLSNKDQWSNIFPHNKDIYIEDFHVFEDFIALEVREKSLTQVLLLDRKTHQLKKLPVPAEPHVVELSTNANFKTDLLRFSYESLITPETIYDYDVLTKKNKFIHQKNLAVPFDPDKYHQERLFIPARDGVEIPVSLLYKKDQFKQHSNPLYLYGYGSYGISMEPFFYRNMFSLVDRGFVFAIAHIRGGAENGKWWYEQGRLLNKKNTFNDFIDCSEYLLKEGYGKRLYAVGGSAGGLLIGSVLNSRPDLYTGLVAHVPFVDVVTTMQDSSIPLTSGEYDEWGNPEDKAYYDYIKSYSPYDNVKQNSFPHILVTSGYHDSQVQYWEPLKWVTRLRDLQQNDSLILLYMDMDSGHSGTTGRFKKLKLLALEYAFLLHLEKSFT
ncbi:MAG: S9 family peptidase [Bdellovibrionales bacterium]|nr:S9 family peptidase [Bdellovibrionales bacterium]